MTKIKHYFPENRTQWKKYLTAFWPIVIAAMLFSADGLVGNFMVGHIPEGTAALAAINTWTNIIIGFFTGIATAASVNMAQHYYSGNYAKVKEIARLRYLLTVSVSVIFVAMAWIFPNFIVTMFLRGNLNDPVYREAYNNAHQYLKIIAINWILIAFTFNLGNMYRETGFGKISLYWGLGSLSVSIFLNSILLYVFNLGVVGAAWGTVAGRVVVLCTGITMIYYKKLEFGFHIWTIFKISKSTWIEFAKRWYLFFVFAINFVFINYRNFFWDLGYPVSSTSTLGKGIGAMTIIGLSGAVYNIFLTVFSSLNAMAAIFVGSELGNKNFKKARINSDHVRGFTTSMAGCLSVLLVVVAMLMPYMTFFSNSSNIYAQIDHHMHLVRVRNNMLVIALYYPIWVWFMASFTNASAGGKGFWFAFTDWMVTGPIQIIWISIITLVIIPNSQFLQHNFWLAVLMFFWSDLINLVVMEILYHKIDWVHSITDGAKHHKEKEKEKIKQ